ncbi:Pkinase-domain-containing protein, partial [Jaminaea rosea]
LGVGTFGEVSRARHIETGADVALKKIKFQANDASNGMPITAIREIKLLKRLAHPNVCPVIDMVYEPASSPTGAGTVYMVLPYMQHDLNGLLERLDSEDKPFTPAQIKLYMKQLLEGTLYLHQNKILHRDIKAANILISNDGSLRIADFGLARAYHDPGDDTQGGIPAWKMDARTGQSGWKGGDVNYTGMVVTRWYRPPELLAGERKYGPAVDMWGMGCLLAEMILRRPLFKGSCEVNQLELIADLCGSPDDATYPGWTSLPGVKNFDHNGKSTDERGRVDFGRKRRMVRERFQGMVRTELADLIDKLLILDPRQRLTAEGALRHPWFDVEPLPADP